MSQKLEIIGRKLVVVLAASVYSIHYWINFNLWITEELSILLYVHMITLNIVFLMLFWCFIVMLIIDPGRPKIADEYIQSPFSKKVYCDKCKCQKPERCHHCSICDRCVLQMDHHCPWINTCVGYQSRKQFILLLFYALLFNFITVVSTTKTYLLSFRFSIFNMIYALACIGNYVLVFLLLTFLNITLSYYKRIRQLQKIQLVKIIKLILISMILILIQMLPRFLDKINPYGYFQFILVLDVMMDIHSLKLIIRVCKLLLRKLFQCKNSIYHSFYEQQYVSSDKNKNENSNIQTIYKRGTEKQKISEIKMN